MNYGKTILVFVFLFIAGFVFAEIGVPHQFYGNVTIDGNLSEGTEVVAKINGGEIGNTVSIDGTYGVDPGIFFIEDPENSYAGKTIEFFLDGTKVNEHVFENGASTMLHLYMGKAPECGDGICNLGEDESCSDCVEIELISEPEEPVDANAPKDVNEPVDANTDSTLEDTNTNGSVTVDSNAPPGQSVETISDGNASDKNMPAFWQDWKIETPGIFWAMMIVMTLIVAVALVLIVLLIIFLLKHRAH